MADSFFDDAFVTGHLEQAVREGVFPSAVLLVADQGQPIYHRACGKAQLYPTARPATVDTPYDLASLTKAIATATIAMRLCDAGLLDLDAPVQALLPDFAHVQPRVRDLLSHASGLPAHRRYWELPEGSTRQGLLELACREVLEYEPQTRSVYSDVGFLVLGRLLETVSGQALDGLFRSLGSPLLGYGGTWNAAATEQQLDGKPLIGVVHDENARAMGGVAPHAGLFGTALGVHDFLVLLVTGTLVSAGTLRAFWTRAGIPSSTWCFGWDTPSPYDSAAGTLLPRRAVGHLGFTGCSIWIDPARPFWVILLSNRVHPSRSNTKIRQFRPLLHDAVCAASGLY